MNSPGTVIDEGRTKLLVPSLHSTHGPGKIEAGSVFFNEQMAFNRDVSVMLLRALGRDHLTVADAMTATGARAVRIANEVPGTEVTANDYDPNAVPYIESNIVLNGLTNVTVSNRDMNCLFAENLYDYVDLDPFGSPSLFIQSAIRGCRKDGVLAVTATDTAPLAGAQAPKCRRRYQSEPIRGYMCHEGGVRILLATIAREMGKFDRGMHPLLGFYADHYYRVYVQVEHGTQACDRMLSQLGYLEYDQDTMARSVSPTWDKRHRFGLLWVGPLQDKTLLTRMSPEGMSQEKRCEKMLALWRNEVDTTPFLYDMSELSSHLKLNNPPLDDMIIRLQEVAPTSKTHFSPTSFITEATLEQVVAAYRALSLTC